MSAPSRAPASGCLTLGFERHVTSQQGLQNVELGSTSPAARARQGIGHRAFAGVLILSLLIVAAYFESFAQVAAQWSSPVTRVAHGWLALAAGLAVLFVNLPRELTWSGGRARLLAIVGGLLAGLLWLLAALLAVESVAQVAAFAVLACAMHAVFGAAIARETDRIILVLACALPILEGANDAFQRMSVAVGSRLMHLLGIPGEMRGFFVMLPAGTFEIEPLCSGLQFFIAAATTAALLAAMRRESWARTAWLMLIAGIIGLLANWLRVITVITAGYVSDMRSYLVHSEHFTLGWSLFVLGIGAFLWRIGRQPLPPRRIAAENQGTAPLWAARGWLPTPLLLLAPALLVFATARAVPARAPEFAAFSSPSWHGPMASWAAWTSEPGAATRRVVADYATVQGHRISVVAARYQTPEKAAELQLSVSGFLPGPDWQSLDSGPFTLNTASGARVEAGRELLRDPAGKNWVFLHWYQLGARSYRSALRARLEWSLRSAAGAAPPFVALIFSSECAADCAAETASVNSLASAAAASFTAQMGDQ